MKDKFFSKTKCDRCGKDLNGFTISFFTEDAICMDCSTKESDLKKKLPDGGKHYAGIGYVPQVNIEWISQ